MSVVVGVKLKPLGKTYYYDTQGIEYKLQQKVIIQTERGVECGSITTQKNIIDPKQEFDKIIRIADDKDFITLENNKQKEIQAYNLFTDKVIQHKLEMKLSSVEYLFDGSKIIFHFTSENRVDFRDLVRELAAVYHTRIELRQIGVRDEAKTLGGIGACGREMCCSLFLEDFQPVSISMAKDQNLSLNPSKISGTCGRLMCCLKYEHEKKPQGKCGKCPSKSKNVEDDIKDSIKPNIKPHIKDSIKPNTKPHIKDSIKPNTKPHIKDSIKPNTKPHIKDSIKPNIKPHIKDKIKLDNNISKD